MVTWEAWECTEKLQHLESVHYNLVQKIKQHFGGHIMHQANLKEPTRLGPNFSNKIDPNLVGSFKFA